MGGVMKLLAPASSLLVERRLDRCYAACMTELSLMVLLLMAVVTGIDGLHAIHPSPYGILNPPFTLDSFAGDTPATSQEHSSSILSLRRSGICLVRTRSSNSLPPQPIKLCQVIPLQLRLPVSIDDAHATDVLPERIC
jgi:hypothetical protein